jgi:hypothetical protein
MGKCNAEANKKNKSTVNPRYNGQNVAVYNCEYLEMFSH